MNQNEEFEELKKLLVSSDWPESVLEFQIVDENSEQEKMDRAEGVIDILIQEDLKDKKFLDFGCGEGHMAKYASSQCQTSIGYDIAKPNDSFVWEEKQENFLLTTDFNKVKENGPYDIILLYDVIDHAMRKESEKTPESLGNGDKETEILKKASEVLSETGKIYLRCHPWCSRHGSHLYRKINKAFVHLVFYNNELGDLGYELTCGNGTNGNRIVFPILSYKKIIQNSRLKIQSEPEIERQNVEEFFKNTEIIANRIKKSVPVSEATFPDFQLSMCFLDYILTK